jgi:phosphatidylethanolamine-binding protein (PEBP) family uncharacterized protein
MARLFIDDRLVADEHFSDNLSRDEAQDDFSFDPPSLSDEKWHTLFLYDPDAPEGNYIHLFIHNIPGGEVTKGKVDLSYHPPRPPSGTHRYIFVVFEQQGKLPTALDIKRQGEGIRDLIKKHGLHMVASPVLFYVHK